MTVPTSTSYVEYAGNDITTSFSVPFRFLADTELVVKLMSPELVESTLVLGVDYSVTGAGGDSGGSIQMRPPGDPLTPVTGATISIERVVPLVQATAFREQGSFAPVLHENAFDYGCFVDQQLARRIAALEEGEGGGGPTGVTSLGALNPAGVAAEGGAIAGSVLTLQYVSTTGDGMMSSADKVKLDTLDEDAVISWQTNDDLPTEVPLEALQFPPSGGGAMVVFLMASATTYDGSAGASFGLSATFKMDGPTITQVGATTPLWAHQVGAWAVDMAVNGAGMPVVFVTGAAATTINWAFKRKRLHATIL